ncbi:MAG TPA: ASPIC/UnbV domain-containing protein, partial [Bryobacteraceae bacterium]
AVVRVISASGRQAQMVHSGSSYCSQSALALTFGLAQDPQATVEIEWPSGTRQRIANIAVNQILRIEEERGVARASR